jgi:hypothetical protein
MTEMVAAPGGLKVWTFSIITVVSVSEGNIQFGVILSEKSSVTHTHTHTHNRTEIISHTIVWLKIEITVCF